MTIMKNLLDLTSYKYESRQNVRQIQMHNTTNHYKFFFKSSWETYDFSRKFCAELNGTCEVPIIFFDSLISLVYLTDVITVFLAFSFIIVFLSVYDKLPFFPNINIDMDIENFICKYLFVCCIIQVLGLIAASNNDDAKSQKCGRVGYLITYIFQWWICTI